VNQGESSLSHWMFLCHKLNYDNVNYIFKSILLRVVVTDNEVGALIGRLHLISTRCSSTSNSLGVLPNNLVQKIHYYHLVRVWITVIWLPRLGNYTSSHLLKVIVFKNVTFEYLASPMPWLSSWPYVSQSTLPDIGLILKVLLSLLTYLGVVATGLLWTRVACKVIEVLLIKPALNSIRWQKW
jgi:hypothetical protein